VLERHQHAEIAGRRVDRADESDDRDGAKQRDIREGDAGCGHERRAAKQQVAQIVARRDETDGQGQERGAEQGGADDDADLAGAKADGGEIGGQEDDGEAVAESAQAPRHIEQRVVGGLYDGRREPT
jgi:hypothetical protein